MRPGRRPPQDPIEQEARAKLGRPPVQPAPASTPVPAAPQPAPMVPEPPRPRQPRKPERWH